MPRYRYTYQVDGLTKVLKKLSEEKAEAKKIQVFLDQMRRALKRQIRNAERSER